MLNKALEIAHAEHNPRDSTNCAQVFVEEGVYYFKKSIYLWEYTDINSVAGKSIFAVEPHPKNADGNPVDASGFFTNKDLSSTYSWYLGNISDLTFVVNNAHQSFKPTSTPEQILNNICSDDVKPVDNYSLFYRVRIKYGGLHNLAYSVFYGNGADVTKASEIDIDIMYPAQFKSLLPKKAELNFNTPPPMLQQPYRSLNLLRSKFCKKV